LHQRKKGTPPGVLAGCHTSQWQHNNILPKQQFCIPIIPSPIARSRSAATTHFYFTAHPQPNHHPQHPNQLANNNNSSNSNNNEDIRLVFSDVDGTLVHYPSSIPESNTKTETESDTHQEGSSSKDNDNDNDNDKEAKKKLLALPPSSTGLRGIISIRTLELAREIRRTNTKLVVVSGMRTSTLLQRLPYLPKADAYCSENGGRIFRLVQDEDEDETDNVIWVRPQKYFADNHDSNSDSNSSDDDDDDDPFRIREDLKWKRIMTSALSGTEQEPAGPAPSGDFSSVPLVEREGPLWDFVRHLAEVHGVVPDYKGYSTCVRVRQKQQTLEAWKRLSPQTFCERLRGLLREHEAKHKREHEHPSISCSVNLGCVDFYPSASGKKGSALYLAGEWFCNGNGTNNGTGNGTDKHYGDIESDTKTSAPENLSARFCRNHAVLLCDDDNDLELAAACSRAYLPGAASPVIARFAETDPERFVPAFSRNCKDTDASDRALEWVLEAVTKERNE